MVKKTKSVNSKTEIVQSVTKNNNSKANTTIKASPITNKKATTTVTKNDNKKNKNIAIPAQKKESLMDMLTRIINELNENPEYFIDKPKDISKSMTESLVKLYDHVKKNEPIESDSLDNILLDGFDNEQIWSQINLYNDPIIKHLDNTVKTLLSDIGKVNLIDGQQDDDEDEYEDDEDEDGLDEDYDLEDEEGLGLDGSEDDGISGSLDEDDYEDDGVDDDDDEEEDEEDLGNGFGDAEDDDEEGDFDLSRDDYVEEDDDELLDGLDEEEEDEEDEEEEKTDKKSKQPKKDIKFFDQKEMEQFLDDADDGDILGDDDEEKDFELGEDDDEDDEEGVEVFPQGKMDKTERELDKLLDKYMNEDSTSKSKKKKINPEDMKFDDFFANPEDGNEDDEEFPLDRDEDEDEEGLDDEEFDGLVGEDEDSKVEDTQPTLPPAELSEFEKKALKIQERIKDLEKQNLKKKNWTVIGEAAAKDRPVNSLLSENLDYDHTQRVAPVITQETNQTLEDIIKKRILDKNFDDVIRKTEKEFLEKYKQKIELNDQKNTEGLGSVYEKEYLEKAMGVEVTDELKAKHETINKLMEALLYKLNSLSNFNYTPSRIKDKELSITKAQAITMEEKVPIATSTVQTVAPNEIYHKDVADESGYSELTREEKKQMHSKLTKQWSKEKKEKEAQQRLAEKQNPELAKKHETSRALQHLKTSRNTTIVDTSNQRKTTNYAKSGHIFAGLQAEQDNKRKSTDPQSQQQKKPKTNNNNINNGSGSKFRL